MKYRIVVVTDGLGNNIYYPQYKAFFLWRYFREGLYGSFKCYRYSLDLAKNVIDLHILENKQKEITKIEFIKYP